MVMEKERWELIGLAQRARDRGFRAQVSLAKLDLSSPRSLRLRGEVSYLNSWQKLQSIPVFRI